LAFDETFHSGPRKSLAKAYMIQSVSTQPRPDSVLDLDHRRGSLRVRVISSDDLTPSLAYLVNEVIETRGPAGVSVGAKIQDRVAALRELGPRKGSEGQYPAALCNQSTRGHSQL